MERQERLLRLIRYDDWANGETLASMQAVGRAPAKALEVFAHILGAERLWLDRLKGSAPSVAVWPDLTLDRCQTEIMDLESRWLDALDDFSPDEFEREVEYVNSKGEHWSNTVGDILNHVLLHSAYHRGQIAAELRAAGAQPAYTDFIHAVRTGVLA